jgi:hypothetical protein
MIDKNYSFLIATLRRGITFEKDNYTPPSGAFARRIFRTIVHFTKNAFRPHSNASVRVGRVHLVFGRPAYTPPNSSLRLLNLLAFRSEEHRSGFSGRHQSSTYPGNLPFGVITIRFFPPQRSDMPSLLGKPPLVFDFLSAVYLGYSPCAFSR